MSIVDRRLYTSNTFLTMYFDRKWVSCRRRSRIRWKNGRKKVSWNITRKAIDLIDGTFDGATCSSPECCSNGSAQHRAHLVSAIFSRLKCMATQSLCHKQASHWSVRASSRYKVLAFFEKIAAFKKFSLVAKCLAISFIYVAAQSPPNPALAAGRMGKNPRK